MLCKIHGDQMSHELSILQGTIVCILRKLMQNGLLAPTFSIAYSSATTLYAHVCSSPGKISEYGVMTF